MKIDDMDPHERIRRISELMYTYGTESRKTLHELKILSNAKYDKNIQVVYSLFEYSRRDKKLLEPVYKGQGKDKYIRFTRNPFFDSSETLSALFGLKKISLLDIQIYFALLSKLYDGASFDINGAISSVQNALPPQNNPSRPTIRRAIKRLISYGCIIKKGRTLCAAKNELIDLEPELLFSLYHLCQHFSCIGYPRVAGQLLVKSIRRILEAKGLPVPPQPFLFLGNTPRSVFDEELLYTLLDACCEKKVVQAKIKEEPCEIQPVYLRPDTRLGRWYLFGLQNGRPAVMRLSYFSKVEVTKQTFSYEKALQAVKNTLSHAYITTEQDAVGRQIHVEAELHFEGYPYRLAAFRREMLFGEIETTPDGRLLYQAVVSSLSEIRPFLRSFGEHIHVLPSSEHNLDRELHNEWERILKNYGQFDEPDLQP